MKNVSEVLKLDHGLLKKIIQPIQVKEQLAQLCHELEGSAFTLLEADIKTSYSSLISKYSSMEELEELEFYTYTQKQRRVMKSHT